MAIPRQAPNTIMLSDRSHFVIHNYQNSQDVYGGKASQVILPGQGIKLFNNAGIINWKLNDSTTDIHHMSIALEDPVSNGGVTTPYQIGDLVVAAWMRVGARFLGLVASGTDLTNPAQTLIINASGKFASGVGVGTASANVAKWLTLDKRGILAADTLVPILRIQ